MPSTLSKYDTSEDDGNDNNNVKNAIFSSLISLSKKVNNNSSDIVNSVSNIDVYKDLKTSDNKNTERKKIKYKFLLLINQFMSKTDRIYLLIAFISLFLSSSTNLSFPSIIGRAVDYSINLEKSSVNFKSALCTVVSLLGVGAFAGWLRVFCFGITTHQIQNKLRKKLFSNLIKQNIEEIEQQKAGELIKSILQDVEVSANYVTQNTASLLRSLNSAVGGTVMLLLLSRKLTLVSLSLVPFVGFCAMFYSKFIKKLKKRFDDQLAFSVGIAQEKILNLKTVRIFGQEEKESENFSKNLDNLLPIARSVSLADGYFMGGLGFAINTSLLTVLFFGGILVQRGELSVGNLTSFALYSSMVGLGVSGLSKVWTDMTKSSVSTERLFNILDKTEISVERGATLEKVNGEISFENVSFSYPSRCNNMIIKNISFKIKSGQVVALTGMSGIGKSTLVDLLLKIYSPTEGKILIDGHDVSELNSTWLRQHVFSVVNQEPTLFSGTILENIKYGVHTATDEEVVEAAKKANAHEFIENLPDGYQTVVSNFYSNLSVGQKQRIAFARAIIKNTPCLILDEPTSALDGEAERLLQNAIQNAVGGRSVLMIAHKPSSLKIADHIIVLDGKINEEGSYNDLIKKEKGYLKNLLSLQNKK